MAARTIGELYSSKGNNFTLLRIIAASMVLWSHSYPLANGSIETEPLAWLGITLGKIAVDMFFIISGFLVTHSIVRGGSVVDFAVRRALRILPGLFVMLLLCIFFLGPVVTRLDLGSYFSARETYTFLLHNAVPLIDIQYRLPGVFETNPYPSAVNGSLWTLPFELHAYVGLALLFAGARLVRRPRWLFAALVHAVAALTLALHLLSPWMHVIGSHHNPLMSMFFMGGSLYLLRDRVRLDPRLFAGLLAAVIVSTVQAKLFFVTYHLAIGYVVLFAALMPIWGGETIATWHDVSYGIYIYAFPIQQTLARFWPGIGVGKMIAVSAAATVVVAFLSWTLVEQPSLRRKGAAVALGRTVRDRLVPEPLLRRLS
ncbi:acyltransferase family protein [Chthonobacter albigriseus]|uniref:acyltransferase family protein n=1 Tax=Chthonobacter albigriseus TaxID=1683161 RepID=UPI0015EE9942|nr:acyltransferase [Chthonobacter albigriseus]